MNKESILEKNLIIDYLKEFEYYCFKKTDLKTYAERNKKERSSCGSCVRTISFTI